MIEFSPLVSKHVAVVAIGTTIESLYGFCLQSWLRLDLGLMKALVPGSTAIWRKCSSIPVGGSIRFFSSRIIIFENIFTSQIKILGCDILHRSYQRRNVRWNFFHNTPGCNLKIYYSVIVNNSLCNIKNLYKKYCTFQFFDREFSLQHDTMFHITITYSSNMHKKTLLENLFSVSVGNSTVLESQLVLRNQG